MIARRCLWGHVVRRNRRFMTRSIDRSRVVVVSLVHVMRGHRPDRRRRARDLACLQRHRCAGDRQRDKEREEPFHHRSSIRRIFEWLPDYS